MAKSSILKENLTNLFFLVIVACLTFLLLSGIDYIGIEKLEGSTSKIIFFISIIPIMFLVLGIHELGHLIAGLAQGFQFQLFVVGPLGVKREDNKTKWYLNKNLGLYGGAAATSPVNNDPDNVKKFARLILAGPLTSLALAFVGIGLALVLSSPFNLIAYLTGAISLAIFFATTIPEKTGPFFTDRKRYQRLTTPGKDQDVEMAMLHITGTCAQDESFKNVQEKDIQTLINDDIPFMKWFGYYNLLCYQKEMNGAVDTPIIDQYKELSKGFPSTMVKAMDAELVKQGINLS